MTVSVAIVLSHAFSEETVTSNIATPVVFIMFSGYILADPTGITTHLSTL